MAGWSLVAVTILLLVVVIAEEDEEDFSLFPSGDICIISAAES